MGITRAEKIFVVMVYLKFKVNWVLCISPGLSSSGHFRGSPNALLRTRSLCKFVPPCHPLISHLSPSLLHPHWPRHGPGEDAKHILPQGLCTCCSLCLKCFSPGLNMPLLFLFQILAPIPLYPRGTFPISSFLWLLSVFLYKNVSFLRAGICVCFGHCHIPVPRIGLCT